MHHAPSVQYPVGRSRFMGRLVAGVWLLGALVVAMAWTSLAGVTAPALISAAWIVVGLLAARSVRGLPAGVLAWDGTVWRWTVAHDPGIDLRAIQVAADLGPVLMLWAQTDHHSRPYFLCLERASQPRLWDDLRRAVYSRAATALPPTVPDR